MADLFTVRIGAVVLLVLACAVAFGPWASAPVAPNGEPRLFTVQQGWGGSRIASELKSAGLIRSAPIFILITNLTSTGDSLQAGTYSLSPRMTTTQIVNILARGDSQSDDVTLTIPEGMNVWEIDALLAARHLTLVGSFARQFYTEEGSLFPDTYRIDAAVASASLTYKSAAHYAQLMRAGFMRRASDFTREQVIIASMVEKEAKTSDDMRLVAGIIAQRRKIGMPLQIDATVGYGWCLARWLPTSSTKNCDVTQAPIALEIKKDGPYNTYMRLGLPVGPISNPGLVALEAAAHPTPSEYLYYLSTRDGSQIIYSKTLAEHNANRTKYLGL